MNIVVVYIMAIIVESILMVYIARKGAQTIEEMKKLKQVLDEFIMRIFELLKIDIAALWLGSRIDTMVKWLKKR